MSIKLSCMSSIVRMKMRAFLKKHSNLTQHMFHLDMIPNYRRLIYI